MVEGKIVALDHPLNLKEKYGVENMNEVFLKIARIQHQI
jgi:ABC-2 type transport system ATP-binding protein